MSSSVVYLMASRYWDCVNARNLSIKGSHQDELVDWVIIVLFLVRQNGVGIMSTDKKVRMTRIKSRPNTFQLHKH